MSNERIHLVGFVLGASIGALMGWLTTQFIVEPVAGNPVVLFGVVGAGAGYVYCRVAYGVSLSQLTDILKQRQLITDAVTNDSAFALGQSPTSVITTRPPHKRHDVHSRLQADSKVDALSQLQAGKDWLGTNPTVAGEFSQRLVRFGWSARPARTYGVASWEPVDAINFSSHPKGTWYGLRLEVLFKHPQLGAFCGLTTSDQAAESPWTKFTIWSQVNDTVEPTFVGPNNRNHFATLDRFYGVGAGFRVTLLDDRWVLDAIHPAVCYASADFERAIRVVDAVEVELADMVQRIDTDDAPAFTPVTVLVQRVVNSWRWPPMHSPLNSDIKPSLDGPPIGALAALGRRTLQADQRDKLHRWHAKQTMEKLSEPPPETLCTADQETDRATSSMTRATEGV